MNVRPHLPFEASREAPAPSPALSVLTTLTVWVRLTESHIVRITAVVGTIVGIVGLGFILWDHMYPPTGIERTPNTRTLAPPDTRTVAPPPSASSDSLQLLAPEDASSVGMNVRVAGRSMLAGRVHCVLLVDALGASYLRGPARVLGEALYADIVLGNAGTKSTYSAFLVASADKRFSCDSQAPLPDDTIFSKPAIWFRH